MENLLSNLFQRFVMTCQSQTSQQLKQQLTQYQPVLLQKLPKQIIKQQFNIIAMLLAKNILTYSPSLMQINLSIPDVFLYQRVAKFQQFSRQYLQKNICSLIQQFLQNGLQNGFSFPVLFDPAKLKNFKLQKKQEMDQKNNKQQANSKKKKKIQQPKQDVYVEKQKYDYAKLIYEYSSQTQEQPVQSEEKHDKNKDKKVQVKNKNSLEKKQQQKNKQVLYMINITQLTVLLRFSKLIQLINSEFHSKETQNTKLFDFYFLITKDEIINNKQTEKIQEHIAQLFGSETLLIFNIIKKFPYITDKQVAKLSLQDILTTRAAINRLVQNGFVYFYNQNARTIVYKIVEWEKIVKKYLDSISQCISNIYILIDKLGLIHNTKSKQKILQLQCEMNRLDDILLLFGY